jgi:hypothetical protein
MSIDFVVLVHGFSDQHILLYNLDIEWVAIPILFDIFFEIGSDSSHDIIELFLVVVLENFLLLVFDFQLLLETD